MTLCVAVKWWMSSAVNTYFLLIRSLLIEIRPLFPCFLQLEVCEFMLFWAAIAKADVEVVAAGVLCLYGSYCVALFI